MGRVILTTVGTSLKGNVEKINRDEGTSLTAADLLRARPRDACAEVNVLDRLLRQDDATPGDRVVLFHSQTEDGESCARAIHDYLREQEWDVEITVVEGLTYRAADFHRGLRSLVRGLAGRIRQTLRAGDTPILNALGGFKSEVVYATLVGALFGIPNYYIHQGFNELLTIPPLPIGWDMGQLDEYVDALLWLEEGENPPTVAEAYSRFAPIPEHLRQTLTETDSDGLVYLSPLGEASMEAYRTRVETATGVIHLCAAAARVYDSLEPSVRAGFDHVFRRLRVPEIRRPGSKSLERDEGDVLVFPRKQVDERVFWYESDGNTYVAAMARHGREYDGLYKKGVWKKDHPTADARTWQAPK